MFHKIVQILGKDSKCIKLFNYIYFAFINFSALCHFLTQSSCLKPSFPRIQLYEKIQSYFDQENNKIPPENRYMQTANSITKEEKYTTIVTNQSSEEDSVAIHSIPVVENYPVSEIFIQMFKENQIHFNRFSDILFIQINRNSFSQDHQSLVKIKSPMLIEVEIDLSSVGGSKMFLYSIVQHIGSANAGHYQIYLHDQFDWILASVKKYENC